MIGLLDNVFAVTRDGKEHLLTRTYGPTNAADWIKKADLYESLKDMGLDPQEVIEIKIKLLDGFNAEGQTVSYFYYDKRNDERKTF